MHYILIFWIVLGNQSAAIQKQEFNTPHACKLALNLWKAYTNEHREIIHRAECVEKG